MGLTIFAQGRLDCVEAIPQLITDVKQHAEEHRDSSALADKITQALTEKKPKLM
ncbi:MAG: hypothetical protein HY314_09535 [Acidobacteria bacterium]|nr:hypothetical protein [Acidobacteriota bacterium]